MPQASQITVALDAVIPEHAATGPTHAAASVAPIGKVPVTAAAEEIATAPVVPPAQHGFAAAAPEAAPAVIKQLFPVLPRKRKYGSMTVGCSPVLLHASVCARKKVFCFVSFKHKMYVGMASLHLQSSYLCCWMQM